jgi:asparagine synthase (glutamine-hydrolysing)
MKEGIYIDKLSILLSNAINELDKKEKYAIAFSGGIDSCVLAKLMLKEKLNVRGYVVGVKNSQDIKFAKIAAKRIKLRLKVIKVDRGDIKKNLSLLKKIIGKQANPDSIGFNFPLYFVAKKCKEKVVVCGQGADELFAGYNKYLKMTGGGAKKELNKNLNDFIKIGLLQCKGITHYFGKNLVVPYLTKTILVFNKKIPYELKIKNKTRKYILRRVGEKLGLGKRISYHEKRAAQYGSGIIWVMKGLAKEKKIHINKYIKNID